MVLTGRALPDGVDDKDDMVLVNIVDASERRRYEERLRGLFRDGREHGELRTDLDDSAAALLLLSAANWAYTWLAAGRDTDALADSFAAILVDGIRGYVTRP